MTGMWQRSSSQDTFSSPWGSWYVKWRPRLRLAHEAGWVGAWFVGGGIALAMGHLGMGVAGLAGGGFFAALCAAGRYRQAKIAVKTADPCPCGSGIPYGACHGGPQASLNSRP